MTRAQELVFFLTTTLLQVSLCGADRQLPAPTQLSYKWIDLFTVNMSWSLTRPVDLPADCKIEYKIHLENYDKEDALTSDEHYVEYYLTEKVNSSKWKLDIHTVGCNGRKSEPARITISRPKSYAKLVKDFKCLHESDGLDCSWIPVSPSSEPTVSYRVCGRSEKAIRSLQTCDRPYRMEGRRGCFLTAQGPHICVLAETEAAMDSFTPTYTTRVSKLIITEDGDYLKLTWTDPEVGQNCTWIYRVSYTECNVEKHLEHHFLKSSREGVKIPYDKCCEYKFRYSMATNSYCPPVSGDNSGVVTYGERKLCVRPLTVVAVVFPILIFLCVTLSCYFFNRNRDIFCQNWQDPSGFKNVLNGLMNSKDIVYTPQMEQTQVSVTLLPKTVEP